jgi:hypothetical protein
MHQHALAGHIQQLKAQLQVVEQKLQSETLALPLLEELKDAVDHIRNTLWAAIASKGDPYEVGSAISRLRVRRVTDMCRQICLDIDAQEISIGSPDLPALRRSLAAAHERTERLYTSGS